MERKAGDGEVCYSENQKTSLGCTHLGDVFLNATVKVRKAESARVFNAVGGQYVVRVSHDIIEADVFPNTTATANSPAKLVMRVNGKLLKTFKHKGDNKDYSIQVNCNDKCDCVIQTVNSLITYVLILLCMPLLFHFHEDRK